jgi:phage baseplate assembly protein W
MRDQIEESINRFEPRVNLRKVRVTPDFDNNAYDAVVIYDIVGIDVPAQELEFVLQATR